MARNLKESYIVVSNDTIEEGYVFVIGFDSDTTETEFFTKLSTMIAMDDCTSDRVERIVWKGRRLYYAGWQPGMCYEFRDGRGRTVFKGWFPELDH